MGDVRRNLHADLALCDAATPGPWTLGFDSGIGETYKFRVVNEIDLRDLSEVDAHSIAEARNGWPHAIRRALDAEYELRRRAPISNAEYETLIEHGRRERGEMAVLQAEVERLRQRLYAAEAENDRLRTEIRAYGR